MNINISFVDPPIPIPDHVWCATLEGYEPGEAIGWGATKRAAVNDLLTQLEEESAKCALDPGVARKKT